jgi:hypothetical protein
LTGRGFVSTSRRRGTDAVHPTKVFLFGLELSLGELGLRFHELIMAA